MTSTQASTLAEMTTAPQEEPSVKQKVTPTPSQSEEFARIDAADRIRSAVRTNKLEKTLEEQRRGDKNDAVSRWQRGRVMAEQLGQQDKAPEPAVRGKAASPPRRATKASDTSAQSPPPTVNSLTEQLLGTSFFDKLPFSFKNDAEKQEFLHESKVLTKRMEDQNWLEMLDRKHRYGSNLKHYHRYWNTKADTRQNFLQWLDEGEGKDLSLEECPRSKLESECISYLTADQRRNYLTYIDNEAQGPPSGHLHDIRAQLKAIPGKGRLRWCRTGELVTTSKYDHGDLGKGRGVALRESQEWQDAIATGEICDVVRDDKIKLRRTASSDSSASFTSDSSSSSDDAHAAKHEPAPHHESGDATKDQNTKTDMPSRMSKSVTDPEEKQQSRKEKLLEKANLVLSTCLSRSLASTQRRNVNR